MNIPLKKSHLKRYAAALFTLINWNGYLAILENTPKIQPVILPVQTKMLPAADQKKLLEGINIPDAHHLALFLQDYLS